MRHHRKQHQITLYTFPSLPSGLYRANFYNINCTIAIVIHDVRTSRQNGHGYQIDALPCTRVSATVQHVPRHQSTMTERMQQMRDVVKEQLSAASPEYAAISIMLGLFESLHTAKQSTEPLPSYEVHFLLLIKCSTALRNA